MEGESESTFVNSIISLKSVLSLYVGISDIPLKFILKKIGFRYLKNESEFSNKIYENYCMQILLTHQIRSDQISRSVVSDSLRLHESQHARPPCPSPTPGVHSDSRPLSQ